MCRARPGDGEVLRRAPNDFALSVLGSRVNGAPGPLGRAITFRAFGAEYKWPVKNI